MATYGRDFYGLAKYGASLFTEFDVNPFDAQPDGYGTIRVSWHSPSGTWQQLRLLKSRYGYAVSEIDGDVVLDTTTPASEYVDTGLVGGSWYYYTLYIKVSGVWHRAGATSSLSVKDTGFQAMLWDRVPRYFRYAPHYLDGAPKTYYNSAEAYDPDRLDNVNQQLQQFLSVLAWGLDWVRTYHDTTMWANDPRKIHLEDLNRLAQQLGTTYEFEVPARVVRSKVANAGLLARRRGTVDGLKDTIALSVGWDVDIDVGVNEFLNQDQSAFANPTYAEWNAGVNYPAGQRVQFAGRVMEAKTGGAYGLAQKPPTAPTASNTWWQVVTGVAVETLRDPVTNAIVTWKAFRSLSTTPEPVYLAAGVSSPVDTTVTNSNSLQVKNPDTSVHTYDVWGAANAIGASSATPQPLQVIKQGIPIPPLLEWTSTETYRLDSLVLFGGRAFRAVKDSTNHNPDDFPADWEKVGPDERPRMALSFYGHADFDGSAGVAVTPGIAFFDQRGALVDDMVAASSSRGVLFDSFNGGARLPWANRNLDQAFGSEKWVVQTGGWDVAEVSNRTRVAWPMTPSGGVTTVTLPTEKNFYKVAVTFARDAMAGKKQALVLRYVDANNYLRVTRTAVEKMAAGVLTSVATLSTPVSDGARVTVLMDETANTQIVYVNGVQVASVSAQPQPATGVGSNRYRHGLMVI